MKTSSFYRVFLLLFCFSTGLAGFVSAKQDQRPYHLQRQAVKKNRYYYYPRQNVYFDPAHQVYFVWERTYWRPVTQLPPRYVSVAYSSSPRFEMWIASTHPYYYNPEHRKTYYEYRVFKPVPPPVQRVRVESRPKPRVNFSLEIHPVVVEPQPVYVEERVIMHHPHPPVYHHPPGHGRGHGHGHGHGHGRHH
ncbi:hypothetical protein [Fluviicola sp.]|uniref:hypothetical protein n=1 Tax=Fluviicola sp. TaxID=1917219 RepID=UPI0031D028DE